MSPRIVDFEHCFPDSTSAKNFRDAIQGTVLEARLIAPDPGGRRGWEVKCRLRMIPAHATITEAEERLAEGARLFGG
jgi:Regulator of ribonuclease activity B